MLVVDHVNDDGAEQRRELAQRLGYPSLTQKASSIQVYADLVRRGFPNDVQILCANHNLKKERERQRRLSAQRREEKVAMTEADARRAAQIFIEPILVRAARHHDTHGPDAPFVVTIPEDELPAFWLELRDLGTEHRIQFQTQPAVTS